MQIGVGMITEKIREDVLKSLEVNGKDMYYIESVLHDKPMVKRIHISSIEIYPHGSVYLKTEHEGSYMAESIGRTLFLTREEADEKLRESYSGDIVNLATLKDCPICHGRAEVREYSHKFAVECSSCGLGTKPDYKLTKAIRLWNERQDE
jgi:hypothetical protein